MIFYDSKGNEIELQEHEDSGWTKVNNFIEYRKVNGIVYVEVGFTNNLITRGEKNIGTLPVGFRPLFEIPMYMFTKGISMDKNPMVDISVKPSGEVRVYVPFDTNYLYAYCSFPID